MLVDFLFKLRCSRSRDSLFYLSFLAESRDALSVAHSVSAESGISAFGRPLVPSRFWAINFATTPRPEKKEPPTSLPWITLTSLNAIFAIFGTHYLMIHFTNKKAQLTQRERATGVHVWRPTANKCKIRKNLYFSAQGHSRSLLSVSIETRVW